MYRTAHAALSDQGRVRQKNEDKWMADAGLGLFVVADGMGGECAGELAAQIVIKTLPLLLLQAQTNLGDLTEPHVSDQVLKVLANLSQHVRQESQGQPGLDGMGATVVLALIREGKAVIAHMGDSRAYLFRAGRLEQLTRDHTLVQVLLDCGEVTREQAACHPARSQLTRHVGMVGEPLPEAQVLRLQLDDRLILCSDGLSGMLSDAEIGSILAENASVTTACERLVAAANAAGGRDNITAVIVAILADEIHLPSNASRSRTSLSISASEPT